MTSSSYWSNHLSWACNSGMLVFGISFALLGAILPLLLQRLDLALEHAGLLFIALNGGGLAITLIGAALLDKRGYRVFLIVAAFSAGCGMIVIGGASDLTVLMLGCLLLGVGGGGLNLGTNALTSDLYASRPGPALNQLGLFFGVGTLLAPLGLGVLIHSLALARLLQVGALVAFVAAGIFFVQQFPAAKLRHALPVGAVLKRLSQPRLKLIGLALFFQSGNEMTIGGWLATFFVQQYGSPTEVAALLLSLFWGALIVGRLVASRLLRTLSAARLVFVSTLSCWCLLITLSFFIGSTVMAAVVSVVIGMAMAPLFPTLLSQASSAAPELSATAVGLVLLPTTIGAMFFPWLAGELAGSYGISAVWWIPLTCFPVVGALQRLAAR